MRMPTKDEMRDEFHRLRRELAAAQEKLKPAQDAYNAKRAEIEQIETKELKPLEKKMRDIRDGLGIHEMQTQMAMLSRALGGETGQPK